MKKEEAIRAARHQTIPQMKAALGLGRTVRGHTRLRREEIVALWVDMMTEPEPKPIIPKTPPIQLLLGFTLLVESATIG